MTEEIEEMIHEVVIAVVEGVTALVEGLKIFIQSIYFWPITGVVISPFIFFNVG